MIERYIETVLKNRNDIVEFIYDYRTDRIGDAIGATRLLQYIKDKYDLRIAAMVNKYDGNPEYGFHRGFNLFEWVDFNPPVIYQIEPAMHNRILFNSVSNFSVWHNLGRLQLYPEMHLPERLSNTDFMLPDTFIAMHILNPVGVRDNGYVRRRMLDMQKYEKIALWFIDRGIPVVRLGAKYDSIKRMDSRIIDFTQDDLTLEQSLTILHKSKLFLSGDTGLKLAASAMNIPIIVEIDAFSILCGGLNGCKPHLLSAVPHNIEFSDYLNCLQKHKTVQELIRSNNSIPV